ncbi:hypothetical protein AX16_006456 [Volvariella volvacea WC 439]|nr:hypothetical protein AX16_006456 [Volvariella volvacea WC 439]
MASSFANPSAQWTALPDDDLTQDHIHTLLDTIPDDLWTVAACADRFVEDTQTQRALLDYGLSRTQNALERCSNVLNAANDTQYENSGDNLSLSKPRRLCLQDHFKDTPADAEICRLRGLLLQRLDRLNTYVEMKGIASEEGEEEGADVDADEWEDPWESGDGADSPAKPKQEAGLPITLQTFMQEPLLYSACKLALGQQFQALRSLLNRHPTLWPSRYTIYDSIPEHSTPALYYDLLPPLDASSSVEAVPTHNPWRSQHDLVEDDDVQSAIQQFSGVLTPDDQFTALGTRQNTCLSDEELTSWYRRWVERVLAETGMIDNALSIIQYAASQGIVGIDDLGEELSLLSRLVYNAPREQEAEEDWTLERWISMSPPNIIHAYLAHSTPESLPKDITRLVMPYLYVLEARAERGGNPDPSLVTALLYDYVLSTPLDMALSIFEASKPTLPSSQRLIRSDEDVAQLALACLYGSPALDQWPTMSQIFECMPDWKLNTSDDDEAANTTLDSLGAFVTPTTTRSKCTSADLLEFFRPLPASSLSRFLDILDVHLESGEILSRWSVPAPLRWFLQSSNDIKEQRAWANRMARRAGGTEDQLVNQDDWEWLLEDMLKLRSTSENGLRGAFGLLSREEVMQIFFSGLLSTGSFEIAKSLLHSSKSKLKLDPTTLEEICLATSREFYDNASSGNYNSGDMKMAYDCLRVCSPSETIVKEREFIEATSRLTSYNLESRRGIPLTPIEIRLTKDKLLLVSQVLSSNNNAYRHTEVIMDLVHRLGFRGNVVAEVKTLAMLADSALQHEDLTRAYEISVDMVETVVKLRANQTSVDIDKVAEASEVCWVACYQLGRQPEFTDLDKKLTLLGHALEFCPPDKIHDVLTSWRKFQHEDIEARNERLAGYRIGDNFVARGGGSQHQPSQAFTSLNERLQAFQLAATPLLGSPDAAALASRTLRTVAASFPFSVGGRSHGSDSQNVPRTSSPMGVDTADVSAQASRAFQKGISWLIGADDE